MDHFVHYNWVFFGKNWLQQRMHYNYVLTIIELVSSVYYVYIEQCDLIISSST